MTTTAFAPENTCQVCGGTNPVWYTDNEVWNAVMRGGEVGKPDEYEFACPTCFITLAEERWPGIPTGWRLTPDVPTAVVIPDEVAETDWAETLRFARWTLQT